MIQFIDLKKQYKRIDEKIKNRINDVLEHGQYIMGPEIKELEDGLAKYVGCKHAIGCSSGTDALLIALMALGIKAGDEVIVPDFTFYATSEVVSLLGATPIFVDIEEDTYNIDPKSIEKAITDKTKAIIAVSLYGQCADFNEINKVANGIPVIEDAAQSFGGTYHNEKSCNLSTISCTSFFPSKPLGGYGDSGAIFTNDDKLEKAMREILVHGQESRYYHTRVGINGRIDTMQAAILIEKLAIFPEEIELRQKVATRYNKLLEGKVKTPVVRKENLSAWAQYTIQVKNRDEFQEKMKELNVPTAVHYPIPLSKQPIYNMSDVSNPVSDSLSKNVVSLPMHPYLSEEDQDKIVDAVLRCI